MVRLEACNRSRRAGSRIRLFAARRNAITFAWQRTPIGIPFSPRGVEFRDGTVRPTYDWFAPRH